MSNKKQDHIGDTNKMVTAVEWLFNDYVNKGVITIEAIEQAKAMEKEQIVEFTKNAVRKILDEDRANPFNLEQYYKETYEQ